MPAIHELSRLPWSAEQMFDLVADVARYPEFLPWVVATRVQSDDGTTMVADMLVGFKALREKFTSRVVRRRAATIEVHYIDGPLRDLKNQWAFRAVADEEAGPAGCEIDFRVEFSFRNPLFEALAGRYVDKAFRKMVAAFEARAAALYGSSMSSATSTA